MNGKTVARIIALLSFLSVIIYPWLVIFNVVQSSTLPIVTWVVTGVLATLANYAPDVRKK